MSSIDRSDARFWCQLIHQPARRSSRLPDRSYWPQLCHQPGPQRQASPCGSCLSGCRRGRPRSLSKASARRLAAGATPRPAMRVGARAVGAASPRVAHATRPVLEPGGGDRARRAEAEGRRARCLPLTDIDGLSRDALGSLGPLVGIAPREMRGCVSGHLWMGGGRSSPCEQSVRSCALQSGNSAGVVYERAGGVKSPRRTAATSRTLSLSGTHTRARPRCSLRSPLRRVHTSNNYNMQYHTHPRHAGVLGHLRRERLSAAAAK